MAAPAFWRDGRRAGAVEWLPLPGPEDALSEHRDDGCSSREPPPRVAEAPLPAACALPASFAAAAARQNIDRRIRRRRRNGEADDATKLDMTHIASLLCRPSSLRSSPKRTEGAGSIEHQICHPKIADNAPLRDRDRLLQRRAGASRASSPAAAAAGLDVRVGPELRCVLLIHDARIHPLGSPAGAPARRTRLASLLRSAHVVANG